MLKQAEKWFPDLGTIVSGHLLIYGCFQWFKDTNLKANHNETSSGTHRSRVVSNGSKILI